MYEHICMLCFPVFFLEFISIYLEKIKIRVMLPFFSLSELEN